MWDTKSEVSSEVIRLHGIYYRFVIEQMFDEEAELPSYLLSMFPIDDHHSALHPGDMLAHTDIEVLKQIIQAAIEEEEAYPYFMAKNGNNLFSRMYTKIRGQKLGKKKNEAFSLQINADLQKH